MFKNEYQGGPYFEVFSAQGKDPVGHWKLSSPGIKKSFDKEVKSFVFTLEGQAATTKMQLPKDPKHSLSLVQRYIIFQLSVPKGQDFAIDLGVSDLNGSKRRLVLSSTYKETQSNPLHAKIPLTALKKAVWLNLCLDLVSLVADTWRGQTYKSLESMCISGNCRLRRIFTMKHQPADTTDDEELYGFSGTNSTDIDMIPRQCQLAPDVPQQTQVINMVKIRSCEGRGRGHDSGVSHSGSANDLDLSSSGGHKSNLQEAYHIAFGTKVPGKKNTTREGGSISSRQPKSTSASSAVRTKSDSGDPSNKHASEYDGATNEESSGRSSRERKNSDPGTNTEDPEITVDKDSLRSSHTWTDGADNKEDIPFVRPHPPREPSSGSRRKPRVKSAGKDRSQARKESDGVVSVPSSNCSSAGSIRQHSQHAHHSQGIHEEKDRLMREMQELARRRDTKSESESDPSSQAAGAQEADDSILEVINTLNLRDQESDGDDENTDGASDSGEDKVYTFCSPPKSAPRLKVHVHSNNRVKKNYPKNHRTRMRKKSDDPQTSGKKGKQSGVELESEFLHGETNSSDDDQNFQSKVPKKQGSPRRAHKSSHQNGLLTVAPTMDHHYMSPGNSRSRMSINKKSLREIPQEELRRSGGEKKYNFVNYQMPEMSDSFEAQMLQSLKREAMEMNSEEEAGLEVTPRAGDVPRGHSRLHYGNDDFHDSSDDTSRSTLKSPSSIKQKVHNYHEEMTAQGFLNQSNPRDWGNVFSPPIVLPSAKDTDHAAQALTQIPQTTEASVANKTDAKGSRLVSEGVSADTDGEEELDLLYDPVLNCYYDPKTCKYYELT